MLNTLSNMDLRLIRVFQAVVEAGGVSAAQGTLNISQSTISNQLAALETRLGYRLCERGRGGFALTAKGERLLAASRQLSESMELFCREARQLDRQLVGQLRIGVIGHTALGANARLSAAIRRFRARPQAVELILSMLPPGGLEEALLSGGIHLGIGYCWHRAPQLEYRPLFVERQLAYCGRDHPLFPQAGALGPAELAAHDWAWRSYPLPDTGLPVADWRISARADNMEAIAALILSGHHLGFLPEHYAAPLAERDLLRALDPARWRYLAEFQLVTRKRGHPNPTLQAFVADLVAAHGEPLAERRT